MRVIPVLDLFGGHAVHARAGDRASYAPLSSQLAPSVVGDARAIARAFRERLGLRELYIADLDAITGGAPQRSLRRAIAAELSDVAVWIDAGIGTTDQVGEASEDGAARVIVGLETLPAVADPRVELERLAVAIGLAGPKDAGQPDVPGQFREAGQSNGVGQPNAAGQSNTPRQPNTPGRPNTVGQSNAPQASGSLPSPRAVFSLDLRAGQPIAAHPALRALAPRAIAELAAGAGFATIIVLDLARVGMGTGPDLAMLHELRRALPHVELVAGGGIRDAADLRRLADAGVDAALVGSALHHGSTDQGSILWLCCASPLDVTSPSADA
jgi:phosphoribosylformimino-5-aminoimidazole carboxamide ribotide isomerase